MRNEKTSKVIATIAGELVGSEIDERIRWLQDSIRDIRAVIVTLRRAKRAAASSLNQRG